MNRYSQNPVFGTTNVDDLADIDGLAEDGSHAWLSLLVITLVAGAACSLVYAVMTLIG